jgi:serine/threonine protein kinase
VNQSAKAESIDWVDRVCLEYIRRRRAGESVSVQDYVKQYPKLCSDEALLDLIDAEICVSEELGLPSAVNHLVAQFPKLGKQIEQLANLNDSIRRSQDSTTSTGDRARQHAFPIHSLQGLPDWFDLGSLQSQQRLSESIESWIYRGRDTRNDSPLALKIVRSRQPIHSNQRETLLDRCEASAGVNHIHWANPILATVQESCYAVVRPWFFGVSLSQRIASPIDATELMSKMSTIAFAIAAAHRSGAFHSGIHAGNVIVDHRGVWKLIDAASSGRGFPPQGVNQSISILPERDVSDLIRMIDSTLQTIISNSTTSGLDRLRYKIPTGKLDAADVGEWLLRAAE